MSKKNKSKEPAKIRTIPCLILIIVLISVVLFIADIYHFLPFTDQTSDRYDWLSYLGSTLSGIATLYLGYVTLKQNETQSRQLDKEREKNEVLIQQATQAPKISFDEKQVFLNEKNQLKLNIRNESELPLNNITFRSLKLTELKDKWHDHDNKEKYTKEIIKRSPATVPIDYTHTPKGEIICSANVQTKIDNGLFEKGKYYRLEFNMLIKNQANITSKGLFYILVSRENQPKNEEEQGYIRLKTYWQFSRNIKILA